MTTPEEKPDFRARLKRMAFKSHPLNIEKDAVSVDAVEDLIEELLKEREEQWISVDLALPVKNGKVKAFDSDSLTPEKELLYEDGRFYYEAYGQRLDYTDHITKWQPLPSPPKTVKDK